MIVIIIINITDIISRVIMWGFTFKNKHDSLNIDSVIILKTMAVASKKCVEPNACLLMGV